VSSRASDVARVLTLAVQWRCLAPKWSEQRGARSLEAKPPCGRFPTTELSGIMLNAIVF
jgi:hypothetical protein